MRDGHVPRPRASSTRRASILEDLRLSRRRAALASRASCSSAWARACTPRWSGRTYFERIAGIPAEVDNSSEFRYRDALIGPDTLVVSVAQSGETVDTLEAMADAKRRGAPQITICNTPGAQTTRVADGFVLTRCGPEVAVASTKTLTASMTALYLLACHIGRVARRRRRCAARRAARVRSPRCPALIGRVLKLEPEIAAHRGARRRRSQNFLFLARGIQYPMAMEGALKLKEVSYIHAEGYPAGEMKHGPIALIDRNMPVVAIALDDGTRDKMLSNIEQVRARDGIVIGIVTEGDAEIAAKCDHVAGAAAHDAAAVPAAERHPDAAALVPHRRPPRLRRRPAAQPREDGDGRVGDSRTQAEVLSPRGGLAPLLLVPRRLMRNVTGDADDRHGGSAAIGRR